MTEFREYPGFDLEEIKIHSTEVVDTPVIGPPYAKPVEIIVDAQAWWQMTQHAREDLRYEAGGIMLGDIYEYEGSTVVRITTSVPAREAVNDIASIQFTYNAWRQMEEERRQRAPTEKLIGWYHTHPGFTAFFSGTDSFMHENFFTQPWHVALVIDPINGEHRFYRWDSGKVVQSPEFLLQVTQWPGPEPPLSATLSLALQRSADQLRHKEKAEGYGLESALRELAQRMPRVPAGSPLDDLLPLIVACKELEADVIAEARRLMQRQRPPDRPIRLAGLEYCSSNRNPRGAISIAHGWLAQQIDDHNLHLHGVEVSQSFCQEVTLPIPSRDLTIDQWGNVFILTRSSEEPIRLLLPPLLVLRSQRFSDDRMRPALSPLAIEWGDAKPAKGIGKLLMGRRCLYLLTKSHIFVLHTRDDYIPKQFNCIGVYPASVCGWSSFSALTYWTDWAVDPTGNLYLLMAKTKEVWRFDQLQGLWQQFLVDDDLDKPRSLCAGLTILSVYDAGKQECIAQYGIPDGQLLCRRALGDDLLRLGIRHIFSDGYKGLYFVTYGHIYFLR